VSWIGPYRIVRRLGTGGMGTVFLARDRAGRPVAVKVLHEHLREDAALRQRFAHEVAAARRVAGFCTARVLDADLHGRRPYLVTEYVDGMSLHDRVSRYGPLPPADVDKLAVGAAAALTAIHAAGVVHRDLKPSNVMLSSAGVKMIDFGIAGAADPAATLGGLRFGTPGWLSPEQLAGRSGTRASDVYAWALLVTWAATGKAPAPDLSGVPPRLVAPVRACLAADPARRPTATDLLLRLCGPAADTARLTRPLSQPVPRPPAPTRPQSPPQTRPLPRPPVARPARPRRRRRRWRLPALALFAVLLTTYLVGRPHGSGGSTQAAVPPAPPTARPSSPGASSGASGAGIRDGSFRFAVTGVRCGADELGAWPARKQAKGQFCLVDLRVVNVGKHTGFLFVGSQRLEDADGVAHTADQWAWVYYEPSRPFTSTVDSGATVTGTLVYDVPAGTRPVRLIVHDTPLSDGATITLPR